MPKPVFSGIRNELQAETRHELEVAPVVWAVFFFFKWSLYLFYAASLTVGSITA